MKPGDCMIVRQERILLVQAYAQRDDPPGRSPVGFRYTTLAESEEECGPTNVAVAIEKVVKR